MSQPVHRPGSPSARTSPARDTTRAPRAARRALRAVPRWMPSSVTARSMMLAAAAAAMFASGGCWNGWLG